MDKSGLSAQEIRETKRHKQIKRIQKEVKRIDRFMSTNQPKAGKTQKEIQSNITDNDSAKMPTSHGVIQGYNAQAMVDDKHQIIVHAEAMSNGQDADNLVPMIDAAKENLKAIGKGEEPLKGIILTADANYHSNNNISKCEQEQIDDYIPDMGFRKRDEHFKDQDRFKDGVNKAPKPGKLKRARLGLDDFRYNAQKDHYICAQGKVLKLEAKRLPMGNIIYRVYRIKDNSCVNCALKTKCLKATSGHRYLCIKQEEFEREQKQTLSQKMQVKVDSALGRLIYGLRIGNIEPVFGNIRYNKGLDRFTYRTKEKVDIQWLLYCLVHNLEKIAHYGMAR